MIKIYEVQIKYEVEDDMKKEIIKNNPDEFPEFINENGVIDVDDLKPDESPEFPPLEGTFHVGEYNLLNATVIAQEESERLFSDGVDIISIKELEEMNLVNWPEDECPYCAAEDAAPDYILEFVCSCGDNIRVADNGWKHIECLKCGKIIDRTHVIGSNGKYILIDAGEDKKN